MNELNVILLFGKALKGNDSDYKTVNKEAIKRGYLVHPDCCTKAVLKWLKTQPEDYNATFYKEWQTVESKSREEIWLDQILNYIFNYGAGFSVVPNEGSTQPSWEELKTIEPISKKEVKRRALEMIYSPMAMKQATIEKLLSVVKTKWIEIDSIKNRELMMFMVEKTGNLPNNPVEMVRYLVYILTQKTLLIKDRKTIQTIKLNSNNVLYKNLLLKTLKKMDLEKLSQVFFRFKPIFLAMKTDETKVFINKLRRLAKKNHKPMVKGFWQNVLSNTTLLADLPERLKEIDNYTKVKLLQTILVRQKELNLDSYHIRNGKVWVKEHTNKKQSRKSHYRLVFDMIYKSLVNSIKTYKSETVYIPEGVEYTVPYSEKQFIGNFPKGTSFNFEGKNAVLGIHRKAEMARGFFDFSLMNSDNRKIGWNENFKSHDGSILFSGDICHNDCSKPAVELFYAKEGFDENWIAKVNNYDGFNRNVEIEYTAFLAIEPIDKIKKNYMVDPNNILFNIPLVCEVDCKEKTFGVLTPNRFILAEMTTGNKTVSKASVTNKLADYTMNTLDCYLNLYQLLFEAGYNVVNEKPEEGKFIDLSLTEIAKDSILNFLK